MATDPRVEVITELRKQTALLSAILKALVEINQGRDDDDEPAVPDSILDGPRGNPVIKAKDPRDWSGEPMNGKRFSECPPAYLDLLADRYDYFATKDGQTPEKVRYAQNDATRARGWAARLRGGWTAPAPTEPDTFAARAEPVW